MIKLSKALDAWGTPDFKEILKKEIEQMGSGQLPLQEGLSTSSYALDKNISVMIIGASDERDYIKAKAGIFYSGVISDCGCADDPTPINENSEYCEVEVRINKTTAEATIALLKE